MIINKTSINDFYKTPLGKALHRIEDVELTLATQKMFGYHLLQIGGSAYQILKDNKIHNHHIVNESLKCDPHDLPFLPESLDAVVLFHYLEMTDKPGAILEEIYNSLIPNGYLVIMGFNPYSILRLLNPIKGRLLSMSKTRHMLCAKGFKITNHKILLNKTSWKLLGASYILVAQKIIGSAMEVKPNLFEQKLLLNKSLANKTATRTSCKT